MDTDFARQQMVEQQIRTWDVTENRILDVVAALPRERFVPPGLERLAYADTSLPLAHGERMMAPSVEGRLLQALEIEPEDEVLEIGTGSGYLAACLASLARHVVSVDLHSDFLRDAGQVFADLGIDNVALQQHDVAAGMPEGQYDAIAVTGSVAAFDPAWADSLKPGGRLFVVTGDDPVMDALLVVRGDDGALHKRSLFETSLKRLQNVGEPSRFRF